MVSVCQRLLLAAGMVAVSAATLHAADTIAYGNNPFNNQFGTVDLNTGVFTRLGNSVTTTGFGVSGGALYGINGGYVYQFNFSTGALTVAPNYSLSNNLQGFGSTNTGLFLVDGYGDLSSVNPVTGTPTRIGTTGVTAGLGSGVLSTSTDSSTLYWVNNGASGPNLYRLNTSTGTAALVGTTGNGAGSGVVQAMVFQGGALWASLGYNTGPAIGTLNTLTGAETIVVPNASSANFNALAPYPLSALPGPSILSGGIVPVDSPTNTIQPGEWVSIYGNSLAAATANWAGDFPISLGNTSVTIDGKPAYLLFVSPTQINVQVPDDTTIGPVSVVVTNTLGSATSTASLAQVAPSFLLLDPKHVAGIIPRSDGSGAHGGGAYDIVGPTGNSLGYPTVAAKAGDAIELFGIGFGPTSPAVPAGQAFSGAAPTTKSVNILINNVSVTPFFAGLSGAGLYQINLTLPSGLGTGDLTLAAIVGGVQTQSNVVISTQ
jgi:uncharacterized protein (TIGR03437 family)